MNIIRSESGVLFKDLKGGDVFQCIHDDPTFIYMKLDLIATVKFNAVDLSTGAVAHFDLNETVVVLNHELVIK